MKQIINRRTFMSRQGKHDEAIAHAASALSQSGMKGRLLSPVYGTFNEIVLETEFDSIAHMQTVWDEATAKPWAAAWFPKWNELTETGGRNEVFVVESSS